MPARRNTYDPFKDPDIHLRPEPPEPPKPFDFKAEEERKFIDRPDHLAGLDPYHPAVLEEEGVEPYPRVLLRPPGPIRIDWGKAAELLAKGTSVESTAEVLRCDVRRIWRNLRRSRKFRARVDIAAERMKMQADLRFRSLNIHAALQMRRRTDQLDSKTLHWLAKRLRMGQAPQKTENLADWLEAVAAPPGPSRRPRGAKAQATAAVAAAAPPAPIQKGTAQNGIQRDSTGLNGTQLVLNGTELVLNGTELALNGSELAPTGTPGGRVELDKALARL